RNALKSVPPQETDIKESETVYWKKDKIGLIEIPLKCRSVSYQGIFDTRANISSITQTYAKKLGLKILDVSYEEGSGITGIKFKTGLGVADSLYFGNILVRNVLFQVMPDSILYIAPIKFSLDIIIGFPVIEQLKEIHLYRDGRMLIPLTSSKSDLHNFALDGLDPVISLKTDQDTLCFHLDLGADETVLYAAYFEKFKQRILKEGKKRSARYGGAGGIQEKEVYVLPALHLSLGNKNITLDSVDVFTKKIFPEERFYGNLGRDFTGRFGELVFNFEYMYVKGF
ncbi:MAG TPA: aspartyl protease family protein, partial [Puia sp.]